MDHRGKEYYFDENGINTKARLLESAVCDHDLKTTVNL